MSSPQRDLASRIAIEHGQTVDRLARLELELTMPSSSTMIIPNDELFSSVDSIIQSESTEENNLYHESHVTAASDEHNDSATSYTSRSSLIPSSPLRRGTPTKDSSAISPPSPTPTINNNNNNNNNNNTNKFTHQAPQGYTVPTTTSLSRQRAATEKSLEILKRKQIRTEQSRLHLVIRKGQTDDELARALQQIKHLKAKNRTLIIDNQGLKARLSTSDLEKQQLRQAMVHAADVTKTGRASSIKRYKDSEDRLAKCQKQLASLRATNSRLIDTNESYSHQSDLILKLEEDKSKLNASLTKTRKALTAERNQHTTMSKLRYDNELLKHENKDLKRTASTTSRMLAKSRQDVLLLQDEVSKADSKLISSENSNLRRIRARLTKVEQVLRATRATLSNTLSRFNNFLLVSSKPILTASSIMELAHITETLGCQTMKADRCELWGFKETDDEHGIGADGLARLVASSSTSDSRRGSKDDGIAVEEIGQIVRETYVTQEIMQQKNVVAAPIFDASHQNIIGVLWCLRRVDSTTGGVPSGSALMSSPSIHQNRIGGSILTPSSSSSSSSAKTFNNCDLVCMRQLTIFISVAYALMQLKEHSKQQLTRVRNVLHDIQQSSTATKEEMLNELTILQNDHANVVDLRHTIALLENDFNKCEYQLGEERVAHAQCIAKLDTVQAEFVNAQDVSSELQNRLTTTEHTLQVHTNQYEQQRTAWEENREELSRNTNQVNQCITSLIQNISANHSSTNNSSDLPPHPMEVLTASIESIVCNMVHCNNATLWLVTQKNGLEVLNRWSNEQNSVVQYDGTLGVVGAALTTRRIINITERASSDPRHQQFIDRVGSMEQRTIKTMLCVPIYEQPNNSSTTTTTGSFKVLGVLQLFNKHSTSEMTNNRSSNNSSVHQRNDSSWKICFDQHDIDLVSLLSTRLGVPCCYVTAMVDLVSSTTTNATDVNAYRDQVVLLEATREKQEQKHSINDAIAYISSALIKCMNEDAVHDGTDEQQKSSPGSETFSYNLIQNLFDLSSTQALALTSSVRATLFISDNENGGSLWSYIAGGQMVTVPAGEGFAGSCVATGEVIKVDDCQNDPRFGGDKEIGFVTQCMMCCPVHDKDGNLYGCIQVINKQSRPQSKTMDTNRPRAPTGTCFSLQDQNVLTEYALNIGPVVQSWMAFFDTKNGMEQQLREAVGGERKMSELIAFLLQVGGTPLRESIGEDLAIELLRMGAKSHE